SMIEKSVGDWQSLASRLDDADVLLEMLVEEDDEKSFEELKSELQDLEKLSDDLEMKKLLNGELDANSAFISINSGAGGTEACDWAQMLFRMYTRYAEKQ